MNEIQEAIITIIQMPVLMYSIQKNENFFT